MRFSFIQVYLFWRLLLLLPSTGLFSWNVGIHAILVLHIFKGVLEKHASSAFPFVCQFCSSAEKSEICLSN